jgi:preprotein translocase subunit SecD
MSSSKRNLLILAIGSAAAAYGFFRTDTFWGIVCCALLAVWALVGMLPLLDGAWRFRLGLAVVLFLGSNVALWPTFESLSSGRIKCPSYVKDRIKFGIAKGLDLQGGVRLVYTVQVDDAIRDKRNRFADEMRQQLAQSFAIHTGDGLLKSDDLKKLEEKVHVFTPESSVIRIKFKDAADVAKIDERFTKRFLGELSQGKGNAADEVVFKIRAETETQIRERAVGQAKETVNRRVDEKGLKEASVTVRDEDIIIEVPGQSDKDFEDLKRLIGQTARLEFKMLDDEANFFGKFKETELEVGGVRAERETAPVGPGKNVTSTYLALPFQQRGDAKDAKKESVAECGKRFRAWLKEHAEIASQVPDDHEVGFGPFEETDRETGERTEAGCRTYYLFARADVTGEYITEAQVAMDQNKGMGGYYVGVSFSPAGADRFEEVTGANVNRRFAIILDNTVKSAPVIRQKIAGGRASITVGSGENQLEAAKELEMVLRSGALPAEIHESSSSKIGASLGEDAIQKAGIGAIVGSLLVLIFMVIYYRKAGLVADAAVLFNLLLQLAVLATMSGTLTLPGIAGLALTIGMAVDANVLINERIREELRAGRSVRAAVEAGYDKAFAAILDGHVTILISGLILAQYGTGPVKGFAYTLIIGIMASFYTGVFCTRLMFDWWARGAKLKSISVGAEFRSKVEG